MRLIKYKGTEIRQPCVANKVCSELLTQRCKLDHALEFVWTKVRFRVNNNSNVIFS